MSCCKTAFCFSQATAAKAPLQRLRDDLASAAALAAATQRHVAAAGLEQVLRAETHIAAMLAEMEVHGMGASHSNIYTTGRQKEQP